MKNLYKSFKDWQTFSFNCNEDSRHQIIELVIRPFIDKYFIQKKIINDYYLGLCGSNKKRIEFAFLIPNPILMSSICLRLFKIIIKSKLFKQKTENMVVKVACHDFVFPKIEVPLELIYKDIFYRVSSVLIQRLSNTTITDSQLLNLSLYLQLGWIKQNDNRNQRPLNSIILQGYRIKDIPKSRILFIDALYENSEELINVLFNYIFLETSYEMIPTWISNWLRNCDELIEFYFKQLNDQEYLIELSYYYVPAMLNKQIGISDLHIEIQMVFINKILNANKSYFVNHE